jgi:chorismate-pyruvate lyase
MAGRAASSAPPTWTRSFVTRVEALAVLQSLNADLLSHDSATLTLERWCDAHKLASPAKITAVRVLEGDKVPTPEQRAELGVSATEPVRYRRVKLTCGTAVLSEADNWYVPARLTADMNKQLDSSDTPFGVVVRSLHFQRHTLSSRLLWLPLPAGWEMNGAGAGAGADAGRRVAGGEDQPMPSRLLEHRAVLTLPDGTPFSEVVETYTDQVLAFPVPTP